MPKATKLVVHFDDGTTYDIPAEGTGSIYLSEEKAKKCGHNPPYKKPPKEDNATPEPEMSLMEGACYWKNGVIVCP